MKMQNTIQPFQLQSINMRGRLVRMNEMLDQIIGQHDYPEWVGFQLAEALLINAAMAASLKLQGKLSLQVQSEGAIKLISTDYFAGDENSPPTMRGFVKYDEERKEQGEPLYKNGVFGIILDQGNDMRPYQGMTRLEDSLAASAIAYFAQSEQIPTVIHADVVRDALQNHWHGGLLMVQQIAEDGGVVKGKSSVDDLRAMESLMSTIEREELLSGEITGATLLYRLFHEYDPTANEEMDVIFGCPCSEDKVRQSLSIYSQKDLEHMTTDDGKVTADCQFCGRHYELDPATVGLEAQ